MTPATRAYLPLEYGHLGDLRSSGNIAVGMVAFCVTAALRSTYPDSDEEELEFIALQQAARHAITAGNPVIVAAVDLLVATQMPSPGSPFVTAAKVGASEVVSFHVGDDALYGGARADAGSPEPIPRQASVELSWFDITELSQLLRR